MEINKLSQKSEINSIPASQGSCFNERGVIVSALSDKYPSKRMSYFFPFLDLSNKKDLSNRVMAKAPGLCDTKNGTGLINDIEDPRFGDFPVFVLNGPLGEVEYFTGAYVTEKLTGKEFFGNIANLPTPAKTEFSFYYCEFVALERNVRRMHVSVVAEYNPSKKTNIHWTYSDPINVIKLLGQSDFHALEEAEEKQEGKQTGAKSNAMEE